MFSLIDINISTFKLPYMNLPNANHSRYVYEIVMLSHLQYTWAADY